MYKNCTINTKTHHLQVQELPHIQEQTRNVPRCSVYFDYWQWLFSIYTYSDSYHSLLDASLFGDLGASSESSDTASCNRSDILRFD